MNTETPKPSGFVRLGIIAVVIYIGYLVYSSFEKSPEPYVITSGIIILLTMLILLVLSESFSSISFGSILRLKRDIVKTEKEKDEAKSEVRELRASLLTMATTVHQSQVTTNISGLDFATLRKALGVVEASPEEKAKAKEPEEEKEEEEKASTAPRPSPRVDFEARRKYQRNIEEVLFQRFSAKYGISLLDVRREVKVESGLEMSDPIIDRPFVYDGYVKFANKEYFIEVGSFSNSNMSLLMADRLYVAIAKVFFYRQIKKVDAELVLLFPILPGGAEEPRRDPVARLLQMFQPAISNNLFRMEGYSFTEQEIEETRNKK